ncbi:hypothetical protein ACVGWI_00425, partial [Enterobacter hormaechei]
MGVYVPTTDLSNKAPGAPTPPPHPPPGEIERLMKTPAPGPVFFGGGGPPRGGGGGGGPPH